tara:strand:- start:1 stop:1290 length:1290 start_codon:yes stop_codon:yes gene_type:complete
MDKNIFEEGPRRGHAAGDTSIEQQASQLASDIKYKARQKMKGTSGSNMSPGQVQQLYRSLLGSSTAPGAVKAIVKKKLFKEQVDTGVVPVSEHVKGSSSYVLTRVFLEAEERKFVIKVVDKATGNTSYRKADRAKIAELRANKNISSVEITGRKEPDDAYKGDPKPAGGKKAKKDYDGDGKIESGTAEYMGSRDKAIKKAMAKEEFIADAKEEDKEDKKLDVMKGKNEVKINPSLGESIKAELDALKAKKVEEAMAAAKAAGPSPEERQQLMNKDKMLKKKIMMQKQTMQMQKQGRLPLNYSEESEKGEKKEGEKDGTFDALRTMKPDAEKDDPRSMPTKINLAKNKLRAMGLKMSYDMKGEMTEGMSVDRQMKISQDYNRMSPEEKLAANKKAMGAVKKITPKKDTRTDAEKMTDATGPRPGSRYRGD